MLLRTLCSQISCFSNFTNEKPERQINSLAFPTSQQQVRVSQGLSLLYHSLHGALGSFVHLTSAVTVLTARECKMVRTVAALGDTKSKLGGQICGQIIVAV